VDGGWIFQRVEHPRFLSNTYLVGEREGGAAVIIDSGGPLEPLLETIRRRHLRVTYLFNTHHHEDHISGNALLKRECGVRLCAHRLDAPSIDQVDQPLEDGDVIETGSLRVRLLHVPGHTAGQSAFIVGERLCFTADTLFRGSVGSTVAPGHTTFADLRRSLVERLLSLPDEMPIHPGHSEASTIGEERRHNPFLRVMQGIDPEGDSLALYDGREVRLVVRARDYDGGTKAWVRFPDGRDVVAPGSRVRPLTAG
jgi:glyoxylase-like metal-dependent hydrolase (beta-lactamase superfamily II)